MMQKHILIIDDEPAIGLMLQEAAESVGSQVTVTTQPDQFKRLLFHPHDILIIDLMIPGTDGVELLRHVALQQIKASIILISGLNRRVLESAQDVAVALGLKVLGVLDKPFRIPQFLELLARQPALHNHDKDSTLLQVSAEELQQAVQRNELVVHYQPQVDMKRMEVVALEALVRWQHPERGLIYPDQFIGLAESSGLIGDVTHAVMGIALHDVAAWRAKGYDLRLSVNISAKNLVDLAWPDALQAQLQEAGIKPEILMLEVTESGLFFDFAKSLDILTRLRMKGFRLSIDDFGTGYSSMQQIMRVPANELKIDRSFVMHMLENGNARIIVDQTIQMAHKLDLKVVAEGVENAEIWRVLEDTGCDIAQGYGISRPLTPAKLTEFLQANVWHEKFEQVVV